MLMSELSRTKIRFKIAGVGESMGELIRFLAPRTVERILRNLPLHGKASIWQEEVYFTIPIKMGSEKAKPKVETGTIAFWPMGSALCIFYGKTQPYSPVNPVGKITDNLEIWKSVGSGAIITVERA